MNEQKKWPAHIELGMKFYFHSEEAGANAVIKLEGIRMPLTEELMDRAGKEQMEGLEKLGGNFRPMTTEEIKEYKKEEAEQEKLDQQQMNRGAFSRDEDDIFEADFLDDLEREEGMIEDRERE